jgi:hypothetical protein
MKILAIAEFDCAGVLGGHRKALRAAGIDYHVALLDVYRHEREPGHDYQLGVSDLEDVARFAEEADILQFHPGIGQPWSYESLSPRLNDGELVHFGGVNWMDPRFSKARRISYFHGSRNAAANAERYAAYWRDRGHTLWASTFDYIDWMGAVYAPPIVDLGNQEPVALRGDDEPLIIAHAPTDPGNCHTAEFMAACSKLGVNVEYIAGYTHAETLRRKRLCNAGFDHLRGSFSINTIENCWLGLAPLVRVKASYLPLIERELGYPFHKALFTIQEENQLADEIRALDDDAELTRQRQMVARRWVQTSLAPNVLTLKLVDKYKDVLA